MANVSERKEVAAAGPAGHTGPQAENDQWRQMAEAEVTGIAGLYGMDVESWSKWFRSLDQPLRGEVRHVMQERFGNAFAADVEKEIAREQASASRALTHDEITNIRMTYGDSIDYSVVRIEFGGIYTAPDDGYARTIGDTIHMPSSHRNKDGSLDGSGLELLYHEIGHVWQYQHVGYEYLPQALLAQLREGSGGEHEGEQGAYQWRDYAKAGTPLGEWNREAQAEMGARYNICLHELRAAVDRRSAPLLSYMQDFILAFPYALQLARGQGANPDVTLANVAKKVGGPLIGAFE